MGCTTSLKALVCTITENEYWDALGEVIDTTEYRLLAIEGSEKQSLSPGKNTHRAQQSSSDSPNDYKTTRMEEIHLT